MKNKIKSYFEKISNNFSQLSENTLDIENAVSIVLCSLKNGNKIIFCGNGGSAGDSQHLAAELMGRYKIDREPLPAIALTVDTSAITAIGNDYGYENIFSRQLKGIGKKGDVLFAISTSGKSKNIICAVKEAKKIGIKVVALTGKNKNELSDISDICIHATSDETNHIQEMHIAIGQLICGIVEETLFKK